MDPNGSVETTTEKQSNRSARQHYIRFLKPNMHLVPAFGNDWFGQKAEGFARYFGTPHFLILQTVIVAVWIAINVSGVAHFDVYPFILLNLAFSLQAAYAAPLILLAQTRQADRDKALAEADAQHREALANAAQQRQNDVAEQSAKLLELLEANTKLTEITNEMSRRIERLSMEVRNHIVRE